MLLDDDMLNVYPGDTDQRGLLQRMVRPADSVRS